MTILRSNMDI